MKLRQIRTHCMTQKGFSLLELLIVVAIVVILAAIAGMTASSWIGKARVEEQTRRLFSDLTSARNQAKNRNRRHFFKLIPAQNQYEIWEDVSPGPDGDGRLSEGSDTRITQVTAKDTLVAVFSSGSTTFDFDTMGIYSAPSVSPPDCIRVTNNYAAVIDCVVLTPTRIRIGRWNGAACQP